MSAGHVVFWLLLLTAFGGITEGTISVIQSPPCMKCGGRLKHKHDCPWDR